MAEKVIGAAELMRLLQSLAQESLLVAPVAEDETISYRRVTSVDEVTLDFDRATVPPKSHFLPQTDELYSYQQEADKTLTLQETVPDQPTVLFGVRPCDVRGILALDPVFNGRFPDLYWQRRREQTTIVALSCRRVLPGCFCKAYGSSPTDGTGADLLLTDVGGCYYVEVLSDKGRVLVDERPDLFVDQGLDVAREGKKELAARLEGGFVSQVNLDGVYEKLGGMFTSTYWDSLARKCIGCGICTFLCPTCHCFDIVDEVTAPGKGRRLRCWDSCMFPEFTLHTSGHNPRPGKKERVRNRFMHKLRYHRERYGLDGCVGCGRCVENCPVNLDIRRVIDDIKEVR